LFWGKAVSIWEATKAASKDRSDGEIMIIKAMEVTRKIGTKDVMFLGFLYYVVMIF
jgi:hypothetical protein